MALLSSSLRSCNRLLPLSPALFPRVDTQICSVLNCPLSLLETPLLLLTLSFLTLFLRLKTQFGPIMDDLVPLPSTLVSLFTLSRL